MRRGDARVGSTEPAGARARGRRLNLSWPKFPGVRGLVSRLRDPVIILPYLGYGTPAKLALSGRVLQDEGFRPSSETERRWRNLVGFLKRMESDEVAGAPLCAHR